VTLSGDDEAVRLAVHNGGAPIPEHLLATLFEPFRRGREGDGDERNGSVGLGLFIVHEIVRAHGGSVAVKSSAAEGTTFTVTLPKRA
jgi:phosphoserine phosphatase RsbU/P